MLRRLGARWIASLLLTACRSGDLGDEDDCTFPAEGKVTIQVGQERELLSDVVADLELDFEQTYCACLAGGSSADPVMCVRGTINVSVEKEIEYVLDESACDLEGERFLVETSGYSMTQSDGVSTKSLARVDGHLYVESTPSGVVSHSVTISFECGESPEGLCLECPGCRGALHFSDGDFHGSTYNSDLEEDTVIITSQSDCPP